MRFVLGRPHPGARPCWYGDTATLPDDFIHACRERGLRHFVADQQRLGITTSVDILSRFMLATTPTFINANGAGPCNLEVIRSVEADDFPVEVSSVSDFSFTRWQTGKHTYVRFPNGTDFEWQGKAKWGTEEEARTAVLDYLRSLEEVSYG